MKFKKFFFFNIAIAFLISTSIVYLANRGFLERLELLGLDTLFCLRGPLLSSDKIIIIELDEESIFKVGRWPWNRTWHAALVRAAKELGAKALYFDILFSEQASEEEDNLFSEAIKEAKNVYLPFVFPEYTLDIKRALFPIKKFSPYIKGTGSFNSYPDSDGTLRNLPIVFKAGSDIYFHIALQVAMDYGGLRFKKIEEGELFLSNSEGEVKIPLQENSKMLINWLDKWKYTFKHYSYLDVLNAYQDILEGKEPKIDAASFKDSICLVGATAIGLYDIASVPIEAEYPAIGAIATAINNIHHRQFIRRAPVWVNWLIICLLALIPSLLISGERVARETLLAVLIGAIFAVTALLLFKNNIWLEPFLPLVSLFATYLAVSTYNFIRISAEKKAFFNLAVTDGLTRLYNIRYFKILLGTECIMAKSDVSKRFCIVMVDIDHFKNINDTYGHRVGDLVLKEVADTLSTSVRSSDVLARYGGEEMIILLRGAPLENGLNVAEELRKKVEERKISDGRNTYNVTISLGVSSFRSGDNEDTIIQRADEGLYRAKDSGRNRVETVERLSDSKG